MGPSFRNIAIVMLVVGAACRKPAATIFGAFLLGVTILSWAISRLALGEVIYTRRLSSLVAFSGDSVDMTVIVENKKPLAIPLVCDDEVPRTWELALRAASGHHKPGRAWLRNEMSLGGFETVTRKFTINCPTRGVYAVGPATISSGDPFGLYPVSSAVDKVQRLTVYPRILPVESPPGQSLYPFGTARAPSWTYQDPSMLKMVREYAPGDARRHVDWKATARSGRLQTRVFDATFGNRLVLCLDLATSRMPWEGTDKDVFESLVVAAASLFSHFHRKGFAVGLASNGVSQAGNNTQLAQFPSATGDAHLGRLLALLAGLGYYTFGTALGACSRPWVTSAGSFPIVVTSLADDSTLALLENLRRSVPRAAVLAVESDLRESPHRDQALRRASGMAGVQVVKGFLSGGWEHAESLVLSSLE